MHTNKHCVSYSCAYMKKKMNWLLIVCWLLILTTPVRNQEEQDNDSNSFLKIRGVFSDRASSLVQNVGKATADGSKTLFSVPGNVIKKVSPKIGSGVENIGEVGSDIIEYVANTSTNIVNSSIGAVENVAEKVTNFTFDDLEIKNLAKNFTKSFGLRNLALNTTDELRNILIDVLATTTTKSADKSFCGLCKILFRGLQSFQMTVTNVGKIICKIYMVLSTFTLSDFCDQIIKINKPSLEYILQNSEIFDPELACSILLQSKECDYDKPALSWITEVPSTTPKYPQVSPSGNKRPIKILHLTDPHVTPDYETGSVVDCGYPTCCKRNLGSSLKSQKAGTWGDYDCDIPPWLFQSTLVHLNNTHKDIDYVYFTGDIVDHTVWNTTVNTNSETISYVYRLLQQTFTNKPIMPVIGNHESHPLNVYPPPNFEVSNLSNQWLYDLMSQLWKPWLPDEALRTVKRQGYYAYSLNKKLKVIALNNNVCYIYNWWLMYSTEYLKEQLEFLVDELTESENIGQFVHILGHVSVGNHECISPWEDSYNNIIERFAHIIKGQFVGHTHTDELKIFYTDNDKEYPINMAFNGASLTPYTKYNPNYKILEVDPDTMDVIDIHTYIFNLTEANLHPNTTPVWFKLYSMKEAYGLDDLSPQNFNQLAKRLANDSNLLDQYWRYYVRNGDKSLKDGCDDNCKYEIFCKMVTSRSMQPAWEQCDYY